MRETKHCLCEKYPYGSGIIVVSSLCRLESPHKAALTCRDFVRTAVRHCVLEWKGFRPEGILAMAVESGIPDADREQVVDYVGAEFRALHKGNAIRYRLRPEDLAGTGEG